MGADLATKSDLTNLEMRLRNHLGALESRTLSAIDLLRRDMELLRRDITSKLGRMIVVAVGVLLAAMRYLPRHP